MSEIPPPRGPLLSPGYWLYRASLAWMAELDAGLRPLGITHTQFNMLASAGWLARTTGTNPTQQEVAAFVGADRMMTSKVIRVLVDRGLVIREQDPDDARLLRVVLTTAGREVTSQAVRVAARVDALFFGTGPDREELRDTLAEVTERRTLP